MEKKILFLDLDGTLLTDSKDITSENLEAIHKATSLGHCQTGGKIRPDSPWLLSYYLPWRSYLRCPYQRNHFL